VIISVVFRNANGLIENRDLKRYYPRAEDLRYINNSNNPMCVRRVIVCVTLLCYDPTAFVLRNVSRILYPDDQCTIVNRVLTIPIIRFIYYASL